jgi:hypothetical protein
MQDTVHAAATSPGAGAGRPGGCLAISRNIVTMAIYLRFTHAISYHRLT